MTIYANEKLRYHFNNNLNMFIFLFYGSVSKA